MTMFFIPSWISDVLLLVACHMSGFRYTRLMRPNLITNLQCCHS